MSNETVTDDIINEGFRSLAQAMAEGFDAVRSEIADLRREMNQRFAEVDRRFAQVDERFGSLEHRMMRLFDERDGRLDRHERRIAALEAHR